MIANKKFFRLFLLFLIIISFFIFINATSVNDIEKFIFEEIKKEIATSTTGQYAPKQIGETRASSTTEERRLDLQATTTEEIILIDVPFSSQAPFDEWSDPRQQDGCEEMAAIMAMRWVKNEKLTKEEAKQELLAIAEFEEDAYGSYVDTSAKDTAERIFKEYFKYEKTRVEYDISAEDIKNALLLSHLVIVPANGRELNNPNYTPPGPERHNLLIIGYDPENNEFITNDAGTRRGEGYRYKEEVLFNAIYDYPTGDHLPATSERKAMIIVYK